MKTTILDFRKSFAGYGHCEVTYTSPRTGKKWTRVTNNMPLVDAVFGCEDEPKQKDLERLKQLIKRGY